MTVSPGVPARRREAGFGLIEIVVAMFLLALLAVAFLPLLVQGITQSSANATLAEATQLVNREMENARAQTTCSGLTAEPIPDNDSLSVTRNVDLCDPDALYPITVAVEVSVARTDTGALVSSATTLIFVTEY